MAAFTSIAAGVGIASSVGTSAMSFQQAATQKKMRDKAQEAAAKMMADARKKLELNVYEGLAIQKEPYELQREALLSQGASALQAGIEGEGRGAAALAGRVQMAQQQGQAQIRAAMGQEMAQLEKLTAAEQSRLRDVAVQLDLEEAAGAQMAAAEADRARAQAMQQGFEGIVSATQQLSTFAPLFEKGQAERLLSRAADEAGGMENLMLDMQNRGVVDPNLKLLQFQERLLKMSPDALKNILGSSSQNLGSGMMDTSFNIDYSNFT